MAQHYSVGDEDERPWGRWEVLACGEGYVVKELTVNPGEILSLQSHEHRAEHWVIIEGQAEVTLGETTSRKTKDETLFIPIGAKHRIANTGKAPLRFVEIQTGAILSESDFVRYEDNYGRAGNAGD